jgi:hypothetical protein
LIPFFYFFRTVRRTMPLNPPPGWNALQERAKRVKGPHELADLIEEMNQLLSEFEITAGDGNGRRAHRRNPTPKKTGKKKSSP